MKQVLFFAIKLHRFGGKILYINLVGMMLIGLLDGAGLLLLLPMLSLIGIVDIQLAAIPGIRMLAWLQELPLELSLPVILALFLLLVIGQSAISRNLSLREVNIHTGFINHLRLETYRGLLQANWSYLMRQRKSDLIHSLTGELGRVTSGTYLFLQFVASLVFTAMQIAIAFFISYQMTLFVLVCGLIIMLMSRKYIAQSRKLGTTAMDLAQSYLAGITDYFNGIKDVKSNQLERSRYIWLKEWSENSARERYENARVRGNSQLLYKTTSTLIIALFIYVSVMLFQGQSGYLLLVIAIFARLWPRFTTLQSNLEQIASAIPSFKALMKLQADCHAAKELNVEARQLPNAYDEENILRRELECRDVSFRYNKDQQQLTLHHISVRIAANEMTAIVGPSGAGKSTLVDLMMGLMEPEEGEVYLDGMPLTAAGRIAMRGLVSYVPQDPFLFHGSIRDNMLLIDPQASDQDIWEALRFSSAAEFVGRLPDGLDTVIGDRGIRLSGGERQRLVLARSILRRPSILILDEATSALDMDNELRIQKALEKLKGMMTIIVIAHRLSTVRNADQVIVLEHGHIVQSGEFDKLSEDKKGLFSRLLGSQLFIA